jgi:hypothetical protein
MPSSNTIALVAVVGSTSAAISVPLINGVFQRAIDRRRYRHEREAKDLDELRAMLDHAAQSAFEFTGLLILFEQLAAMDHRSLGERRQELTEMRSTLYTTNARFVIRRGREDDVVKAFGRWLGSVDRVLADFDRIWVPHGAPVVYGDDELELLAKDHWEAYEGFLDAAQALVGSTLAPAING